MIVSLGFSGFSFQYTEQFNRQKVCFECLYCHAIKSLKPFDERSQENEMFEKIDTSTIFQIPSIFSSLFLSYLPKHVTRFYNAMYGDAMLVFLRRTPIWRPEINKNIWG